MKTWVPSKKNIAIVEKSCGTWCEFECDSISMEHKTSCRTQLANKFQKGGVTREKNILWIVVQQIASLRAGAGKDGVENKQAADSEGDAVQIL